jgi:O-antigen/teichoic acid export membrane protein
MANFKPWLVVMKHIKNITSSLFIRNYVKVFSVDILVKGAGIILLPVYLRLMTQDEFGLYGYLVAIISTFSLVFNLGIYVAQSKLYHDYPEEKRGEVLFTLNSILLFFILSLLVLIFIFNLDYPVVKFMFKTPIDYDNYRTSVLLGVVVAVYSVMLTNFFLTSEDIKKVQLFNISRILLVNCMVIGILYFTGSGDHTLMRLRYSNFIECLIIVFFSFFYFRQMKFHFNSGVAVKAIKISSPILASAIIGIFINLSDRYFIDKYGTLKDLSIYNVALTFSGIVPFVFASFQNVWLPQFLKERDFQSNRLRSKKMMLRLSVIFILLSLAILLILKIMLVFNVINDKYEAIMPLLPILLVTGIISSLTPMFSNHLIYLDKLYLIVVIGIPIAILGVALNIKLVPLFNIYGAAIATMIASACYLIAYSVLVNLFYKEKMKGFIKS